MRRKNIDEMRCNATKMRDPKYDDSEDERASRSDLKNIPLPALTACMREAR